jgi:hypothetical protein
MKNKPELLRKKSALTLALSFIVATNPLMVSASTIVAPNIMVILGNSYSMNRMMDNINLPSTPQGLPIQNQCPANYSGPYAASPVFANDPACGGTGTPFGEHQYGNQPDSKLYIAKDVLYKLMQSHSSDGINIGLATYRQALGLENSVATVLTNTFWPNVFPKGGDFSNPLPGNLTNQSTAQLTAYGSNPDNMAWVSWWPAWDATTANSFAIGVDGNGNPQPDNAAVTAFSSTSVGLPYSVQYPQGQQSTRYENNQLIGNYYYGSGGLDMGPPINSVPNSTDPKFTLCRTYYDSQSNAWQGEYIASNADGSPHLVVNTYPDLYNGNTIQYIPIGSTQYNTDGSMNPSQWADYCSVGSINRTVRQESSLISNKFSQGAAYFNYIPSIYDGASSMAGVRVGQFTGWSGAATYNPRTNTYIAHYPSGAQSSRAMGNYNTSGAKTMGAFIDLPRPDSGYIDQRALVSNLVNPAYPQWDDSGLGYNQNAQVIKNNGHRQSISASDYRADYDPHQSPVFDSLMDAAAYFSSYKKKDPYDGCRNNQILLIYDGHEDANYTTDANGNVTYADPALAAKALLDLGVKVNVIIISNNPGDIAQANAVAAAGGTGSALTASNATSLSNEVLQVFAGLNGVVANASPAMPGQVSAGSLTYLESSNNQFGAMQGHLSAYPVNSDGTVGSVASWDAAYPAIQSQRGNKLWSDVTQNGAQSLTQWTSLPPGVFQAQGTPDAATVSAYTVDPNSSGGAYLFGRAPGSIVGTMTSIASKPQYVAAPSNPLLLATPGYATYAQSQANRAPIVLWSANDGFLYSSDAKTGSLNWAYMPSPLLPLLKNYTSFESSLPMAGGYTVVDGLGRDGAWHSFVVGTAQSGAIHYGFQLADASMSPDSTQPVLIDNQAGATSPQASAPALVWDSSGDAYAIYTTVNGNSAQINVISSTGVISHASLPFVPSSAIAINNASGNLYIGATNGAVYTLSTRDGYTAPSIAGTYSATTSLVGNLVNSGDPAQYVGFSQNKNGLFLWASGKKQISVFAFGGAGWETRWTTQDAGPSTLTLNGVTTTYATDPGTGGAAPQYLPASGSILDNPVVANSTLIVPVTLSATGLLDACTASSANYYLFNLSDGGFPLGAFTDAKGNLLTSNVNLGSGIAFSPTIAYNPSIGGFAIYGGSQQSVAGLGVFSMVAKAKSSVTAGIIGLRPVSMTHP